MTSVIERSASVGHHAIVIGGSMAGLLAGRVLADHFERVTIVERDRFPVNKEPRKGIPQCTQLHILLTRGRIILEQLFPGLEQELIAAGAVVLDMGRDVEWLNPYGWVARFESGFQALSFSRYILDWLIQRRMRAFDNVRFLEASYVTGLLPNANSNVAGVSIRQRDRTNESLTQELSADLVVDASGFASQAPKWLKAIGYEAPEETVITPNMGYASRIYAIPADFSRDWKGVYMQASPPQRTSMGVLYPIEGNRWIVGACNTAPHYPPTDEAGFLEALRNLPSPIIYDAVKAAKPLTPIQSYHPPGNCWRHYERLARQPEGFIALGDAVCCFTPIYGQGITVAAMGAIALNRCLRELQQSNLVGLAKKFQQQQALINTDPWIAATSQDARYPSVKGITTPSYPERFVGWYMNQLLRLTTKDPNITLVLFEVFHMLKSSSALFQPKILIQVLKHAL